MLFQGEKLFVAGYQELGLAGFSQREQIAVLGVGSDRAGRQILAKGRKAPSWSIGRPAQSRSGISVARPVALEYVFSTNGAQPSIYRFEEAEYVWGFSSTGVQGGPARTAD